MPEGSTEDYKDLEIYGAGAGSFGKINFEAPGEYEYIVNEINGGIKGYTYDTSIYKVKFTAEIEDGMLQVTQKIFKGDEAAGAVVFTNPFEPGGYIPQTGVVWWPVPVLICLGLVFITAGVIRRRRYH